MNSQPREGGSHVVAEERLGSGQAARLLEVSPSYLARLARLGRIEFEETPHGYRVYRRSDLEDLQRERSAGTAV